MSQQPNHPQSNVPEEKKSNWILISLLVLSTVMAIAFFFFGLIRQFQAEENAAAAERAAIAAKQELAELRAVLEECQKGKSSSE